MAGLLYELVQTGRCRHEAAALLAQFPQHNPPATIRTAKQAPQRSDLIEPLTKRELEVVARLSLGLTNKEIARELCTSPNTVRNQITNIYAKLHVNRRREAVLRAQSLGLLPLS